MSRNPDDVQTELNGLVAPREGRVSRNMPKTVLYEKERFVAPREGRVSRNRVDRRC